jgi:ABC-type nitrate/sulfonate/bicarbonate transport system substrate-binding protein
MIRLRIGGVPEHFNLPWRQAIEDGSFKKVGLDLHWSDMTGGTGQMVRGLETGSLDVAVLLTEGLTLAVLKGLKAKILQVYVTSPLCWGIHVPFDSKADSVNYKNSPTFAISREGSGSHLMAYVLADKFNWQNEDLNFNVVGDIYGGLWALQNTKADFFLWEKYTTAPFVQQGKCKRIDEIYTPWPCFVIAVRNEVYNANPDQLHLLQEVIIKAAKELKNDPSATEKIAWRYNLEVNDARKWLQETSWALSKEEKLTEIEQVVSYLNKINLITSEETSDWENKLIVR